MNKSVKSLLITGSMFALIASHGPSPVCAAPDDLLKVLEANEVITAEQSAGIRKAQPQYTVRPSNKVVQDIAIRGRVQTQFGYVHAKNDEASDNYSTFEMRRVRLGMRGMLLDNVRAQIEANLVPGSDLSMRSAFIQWREMKPAYVKLGYDKPHSSIEENTSSAEMLTVERTLINNTVAAPGPVTGLSLDGAIQMLVYGAGIYTDAHNRNSDGRSDYMYNAMAGLDLDDLVGKRNKLLLRASYLNSGDSEGAVGSKYDDCIMLGASAGLGRFDLRGEYMTGKGDGGKITGWYIMPAAFLTERLQVVARFENAASDKDGGLSAPGRYMRRVATISNEKGLQRGSDYNALYLGLNHYFSGHPHKLMLGAEMSELKNTDAGDLKAATVYTAWRMLF